MHALVGHTNKVYAVECDGKRIVSGSMDHTIRVWDMQTGRCLRVLEGHRALVGLMQLRGDILVSGAADHTLRAWNVETGAVIHAFDKDSLHTHDVWSCLWGPQVRRYPY